LEPNRFTAPGGTTLGPTANDRPGNPNGTPARDYLKVATLNIRGRTSTARGFRQEKWFEIPGLMNAHRIAILGVQEAHLTEELANGVSSVFEARLKLFHSPLPESSNAAGVAIVVNKGLVNADAMTCETLIPGRVLMVTVPWHASETFKILNVYAPNDHKNNECFWETLNETIEDRPHLKPDVMLGDFNLVEDALDRIPCHPDNANAVAALGELKSNTDLVDGWRRTHPDKRGYTHHHAPNASQGRIDRIYITNRLLQPSSDWNIESTLVETDHWLASARITTPDAPVIGRGRWQIPAYIFENEKIMQEINERGKSMQDGILRNKFRRSNSRNPQTIFAEFKSEVTALCRGQEKRIRPTITNKIENLKRKLEETNNDPFSAEDDRMLSSIEVRTEILELERVLYESSRVYAKAKHHVHTETICRDWVRSNRAKKPRDTIFCLFSPLDNAPTPEYDSHRMSQIARDYHERLQSKDRPPTQEPEPGKLGKILDNISSKTSPRQKVELAKYLSTGDVHKALHGSGNDRAAGLDGVPMEMWKKMSDLYDAFSGASANPFCDVVGSLVAVFNDIEEHGIDPSTAFNEGWMCPIYKKGERSNIANYRPITLLNTDYKVMTKAMANKLAEVAPTLIHKDQAGFVRGRSIFDQVKLAKLAVDYGSIMGVNGAIFALDQEKAYDRIMHPYLWKVLEKTHRHRS